MKFLLTGQQTERLDFKIVNQSFFDLWIEFFQHPDSARFLGLEELPTPLDQCKEWFRRVDERYQKDLGGMNALIDRATNEFVGQCGLLVQEIDGIEELEIGYSILPRFWNKGYATEAAIKCRDFAFQHNFSETLISIISINNVKSEKVALKNGMQKTKQTTFKNMQVNIFRVDKLFWRNYIIDKKQTGLD
jgi:ribosomal-protein-alanine N-acetyltransferase